MDAGNLLHFRLALVENFWKTLIAGGMMYA
jgi:hypothetical protein